MKDSNSGVGPRPDSNDSCPEPANQAVDEKLQKLLDKALYGGGRPAHKASGTS